MTAPLLQTKLYVPPRRSFVIPRPRLAAKLDAALAGRVTLISAPAGYGKTTLVANWAARRGLRSERVDHDRRDVNLCWLALENQDNDPARFWAYAIAALQTARPAVGEEAAALLQSSRMPAAPVVLTSLINDLAALPPEDKLLLALDDYHLVEEPAIHEGLAFLVDHAPPQLHVLLLTRADPPLPLVRWRARREMAELRQADLRFTRQEVAALLNDALNLALTDDDVAALTARTEGWAAGLQLAALSLQDQADRHAFVTAFTGSHFYVLEYLATEVLEQQPAERQAFLLQTSILDPFSAELCAAVTGRDDCAEMLADLYRSNVFLTALDPSRTWFRYHHLFADLLQTRLSQTASPETIGELRLRASGWLAANGEPQQAIGYAAAAGAYDEAAELLLQVMPVLAQQGQVRTVQLKLEALPEAVRRRYPTLQLYLGWSYFLGGRMQQAAAVLEDTHARLAHGEPARGEAATLLAIIASTGADMAPVIAYAEEALAIGDALRPDTRVRALSVLGSALGLDGDTAAMIHLNQEAAELGRAAGDRFVTAHALELVASGCYQLGALAQVEEVARQIIALAEDGGARPRPFAGIGHLLLAEVAVERNQLAAAVQQLQTGIELCQRGGIAYALSSAYITQGRLALARGEPDEIETALEQLEALLARLPSLSSAVVLAAQRVRCALSRGDTPATVPWAAGERPAHLARTPVEQMPLALRELQQISQAQVLLAQGQPRGAVAMAATVLATAEPAGRRPRAIEALLVQAAAQEAVGAAADALAATERALAMGAEIGLVRLFVEHGAAARRLIARVAAGSGAHNGYANSILQAWPAARAETAAQDVTVESLSEREMEVLQLIATGLTNRQIADRLTVSLNTIKKHSSNIYGKLDVRGRTAAVARARELGLL